LFDVGQVAASIVAVVVGEIIAVIKGRQLVIFIVAVTGNRAAVVLLLDAIAKTKKSLPKQTHSKWDYQSDFVLR
jgi:hypothetical protein